MEERERELFKKAWLFLASETAAGRGVQIRGAVVRELTDGERPAEKKERI